MWTNKVPCIRHWRRWGCKSYVHIPKAKRVKNFDLKCHEGYLVGYNDQDAYIVYVPSLRKTVTSVSVTFNETIPTHAKVYWQALADPPVTDIEEGNVADFKYLVGKRYIDDENGFKYETTRVVVEKGFIVSHCVAVQADDTTTSI